jgi:hypothetical protein
METAIARAPVGRYDLDDIIPAAVLKDHIAVVGKTGSGKSSTARLIVERAVAEGARVCILDTTKSDWWGITLRADGLRPAWPFKILGGPRGHVDIRADTGKAIGKLVATGALPLTIVDMANFEAGGVQRFFVDFAEALFRNIRGVVYLVIEEAHEVAPKERAGLGAENMSIYWAKKLATASRTKGIRLIVCTQTVQQLHNRVLGSCETIIAHRMFAPADKKPIIAWLKDNTDAETIKRVAATLQKQPTGTAWVCSGLAEIFRQSAFPKFATFDNTATPDDNTDLTEIRAAPVDQAELRAILGEAVAYEAANDPTLLREEIERLKQQLTERPERLALPSPLYDSAAFETARTDGQREGYAAAQLEVDRRLGAIERAWEALRPFGASVDDLGRLIGEWIRDIPAARSPISDKASAILLDPAPPQPLAAPYKPAFADHAVPLRSAEPAVSLPGGEKVCLVAIAQHRNGVTRPQLTVLTGYKRSSRDAYIQRLRGRGYLEERGDRILANQSGVTALGADFDPLPTGRALRQRVLSELPEGERKVLECVVANYPRTVPREAIDKYTGYKRSSRDAYVQRLGARELVVTSGDGVTASGHLF